MTVLARSGYPTTAAGVSGLRARTSLSTRASRLALAVLLAAGGVSLALPARANNFNVANDAQLRSAISSAGNGDTITFTANITLASNLPTVTSNITFKGGNFTLSGDNQYRGLFVEKGTVAINDLTIANAKAQGGNGGAAGGVQGSGGGGGAGLGSTLFIAKDANVTVSNVSLRDGTARGGNGGPVSFGSSGTSGGGGGYWPTGANGGDGGSVISGGGGTGGGGDGSTYSSGSSGGFGGGGGGGATGGGAGGFGGGGGGGPNGAWGQGGFLGGDGGLWSGGGGAGLGGAIFVQQGGTLALNGSLSISGNTVAGGTGGNDNPHAKPAQAVGSGLFLAGNGSLVFAPGAGQTQTISDAIVDEKGAGGSTGSWSLVKDAPGTTILTGANKYSGGTTVNSGILQGNTTSLQGNILNNANVVFDQPGGGTYAGNMSGTGALTKSGAGAVTLGGTNTYSGGTVVNGGSLLFTSDANLGAPGKGISLNNGTIGLVANSDVTINRPITVTNRSGFVTGVNSEGGNLTLTWTGAIGGTGVLIVSGSGDSGSYPVEVTLGATNSYAGGTEVNNLGRLRFTSDANLGAAGTEITLNAGTIGTTKDAVAAMSISRPITLIGSGSIDVALNPLTWSGNITGDGQLIKGGAGVLTLTGATNTYSGGTVVKLGTLQVPSDAQLGAAGKGVTLTNNGGLWATGTFTTARPFTLTDPGGVFQVDTGQTLTLTGVIDGPGSLSTVGTGTIVLAGTSNYSGIFNYGGTVQGNTTTLRGNIAFDTNAQNPNARSVTFDQATDGTFAGTITGIGSVKKIGAGTLTLSGDNTYSTGTTVSAGTLQGTTRSLQGAITNNAAVIFDQAFNGTYAGDMTGTGTLTKNGTGNLNLTGAGNVVGGGTTINAGGFAVNGHLTSNVTLNKGGILSGVGNIKGDITNNGGTIKPGNSIGHLTVDGNFTFNGGTYEVEVNAKGDSDRVNVVGAGHKVMINAGTLQIVPEAGTYAPNTTYTIITTEGGGTVLFDEVTGGVGFLTPKVSLDREHIYVTLALAPNAFRSAGQTVNQQAVGGALDASAAAGNVGGLVTAMANLPTSQGSAALQALSGQPYADFATINIQASQLFMNAVGRQMAVERGAGFGAAKSVALATACEVVCDADSGSPRRLSAWLSGIGSTGSVAGDYNAAGLTYTLGGTAFGIDYRLDPRFLLGIAGGYLGGTQWVNGFTGNGYTDALSVALYASFTQGGFYADALAGYANASNRMQRVVAIPGLPTGIASGNTNANQFLGQIETGYRIGLDTPSKTSISPFARLQVGSSSQTAFSESGASLFNLSVAQQTTTSVRTTFGADFAASFDLGRNTPLDLGLRLGWMHEFADTTRPMTAAFAAAPGPQFTVWGATPQRDSAVIGFSAATRISDSFSLFASYDGELGGGTNNHQLRAGFRLTW